jgi:hypothetical protein
LTRLDSARFFARVPLLPRLSELSRAALEAMLVELAGKVAGLERVVAEQREQIAHLKGLKGKPRIPPSGMDKATEPSRPDQAATRRRRGKVSPRVAVEDAIAQAPVPPGSRFKGYVPFLVQDLVISARAIRYRRERWIAPDGRTILAPLPEGVDGHFGPELRRFVLMQYHQGQSTLPRLADMLRSIGVAISKRQLQRLLTDNKDAFVAEAQAVLRAGLETSAWVSVDDTGARHKSRNGFCTTIGNDRFAWFGTRASKSRLNFLELLRAGHTDYVLNDAAYGYMREHNLASTSIERLRAEPETHFADPAAWTRHLERLGLSALSVAPNPVRVATEGALWGSIQAHRLLPDTVVLSDDAGQFAIGRHALCWVHAERLVHKLDPANDRQRRAQALVRGLIWDFYADLKAYKARPASPRAAALRTRFDAIFDRRTGFATLDRLLRRLRANKAELLAVLDRPEIPLHTNGAENDIRCQVVRRKVSAGTRSDTGRDGRDAFLGLARTCRKVGVEIWDYLGDRLKVAGHAAIQPLEWYVRQRVVPA